MNYKNIINIIGKVLQIEAMLLLLPLLVGAIYKESWDTTLFAFFITALGSFVVGVLLNIPKPKNTAAIFIYYCGIIVDYRSNGWSIATSN